VDDYDWERLEGGGFAVLRTTDGATLMCGQLPADIAWGTGGVAVAPLGRNLVAVGRTGRVHLIDPRDAHRHSTPALADTSLGMAHLGIVGDQVLFGFNRGGYVLHLFAQSPTTPDGP
jgi:hypothetical protein